MIRHLTAIELRQAQSIARTIFPGAAAPEQFFSELLVVVPLPAALGLRAAIVAAAVSPVVVLRRPALFAAVSEPDRVRILETLAASRLHAVRSAFTLLKAAAARGCAGGFR